MTKLKELLIALDQLLTGKAYKDCLQMARQFDDPEKFLSGSGYYLSDGGYSRVYISVMEDLVFLTSNSLDKPRANWETLPVQAILGELMRVFREIQQEYELEV